MTFTEQELQNLSAEIDNQLSELANESVIEESNVRGKKHTKKSIPHKQKQQLEQATGENADSFWDKFKCAAKKDLCVEGGKFYGLWQKYGDLDNKTMLIAVTGILSDMGVATTVALTIAVPLSVCILHITIQAICEKCE
jgi:hypothetical protein